MASIFSETRFFQKLGQLILFLSLESFTTNNNRIEWILYHIEGLSALSQTTSKNFQKVDPVSIKTGLKFRSIPSD